MAIKVNRLFYLILISTYVVLSSYHISFAMDSAGCLICHQYPGLVSAETDKRFKRLHIDEKKYLDSLHGKVACRKCHVSINKVPHTGNNNVACVVQCHQDDKNKIGAIDLSSYQIHENEKLSISRLENISSCLICHPLYPHMRNNQVRAFLNMHTGFMVCTVCHIDQTIVKDLTYKFKKPEYVHFAGGPFGNYYQNKLSIFSKAMNKILNLLRVSSWNENIYWRIKSYEYSISRIALFPINKVGELNLMNIKNVKRALKLKKSIMDPDERKKELDYIHENIVVKEFRKVCYKCHSSESVIDYKEIGYNENKARKLGSSIAIDIITKYDSFYFPAQLFN